MRRIGKKLMVLATLMVLTLSPLKAQVFIGDNEFEGVLRQGESEYVLVVPNEGSDADQYTPLGEGMLLLALFGEAYLHKKRKEDDRR